MTAIWPFAAEWSQPISEKLQWLTAIQTSRIGAEQRQSLRLTPRREIDYPFQLYGQERSYFDVLMQKFGGDFWYVPLPHEEISLAGPIGAGETNLSFDTAFREIGNGTKLLLRDGSFRHEIVDIVLDPAPGYVTISPTVNDYPNGCIAAPVFLAKITDTVTASRATARAFVGTVRFTSQQPLLYPPGFTRDLADFGMSYGDPSYPVLTQEPNSAEYIDYSFLRMLSAVDNDTGIPAITDRAGRAFVSQHYSWFLVGRQEQSNFRDLMFRLRGKACPLWVPTFNDDIVPGSSHFVDPDGVLAPSVLNRQLALVFRRDGTYNVIPISPGADISEDFDNDASVYRISFLSLKRLDVDEIEFMHYTDTMTTVSAILRDAPDLRVSLGYTSIPYNHSGYITSTGTTPATNDTLAGLTDPLTVLGDTP